MEVKLTTQRIYDIDPRKEQENYHTYKTRLRNKTVEKQKIEISPLTPRRR